MSDLEYDAYLQFFDLYTNELQIDDQLSVCDQRYAYLQNIVWNATSEMQVIEQYRKHLWEEKKKLNAHILLGRP